jgi:hypothetical protein
MPQDFPQLGPYEFLDGRGLIGYSCPIRNLVPEAFVLPVWLFLTGRVLFGLSFQIPVRAHGRKQRLKFFYDIGMPAGVKEQNVRAPNTIPGHNTIQSHHGRKARARRLQKRSSIHLYLRFSK